MFELIIKSQPIDLQLTELLGDKPCDFIVLCLDGVPLEGFGTPYDTPENRARRTGFVDSMNDPSGKSLWPEFWVNWAPNIIQQFKLPATTTAGEYRPKVSLKISRVCPGYSEYLHAAIGLFEQCADKIQFWSISQGAACRVTVFDKTGHRFSNTGSTPSQVIAETIRDFLIHSAAQK